MTSLLHRMAEIPTKEEDDLLISKAQSGDLDARNELIKRHLPFIIKMATGQRKDYRYVTVDDLAHVCVLGMIHAIRKYDASKAKGRFITYASKWMITYIQTALDRYSMYRCPNGSKYHYNKGRGLPHFKAAVEGFKEMTVGLGEGSNLYSRELTPLDQAIFNEELKRYATSQNCTNGFTYNCIT